MKYLIKEDFEQDKFLDELRLKTKVLSFKRTPNYIEIVLEDETKEIIDFPKMVKIKW